MINCYGSKFQRGKNKNSDVNVYLFGCVNEILNSINGLIDHFCFLGENLV